MKKRIFMLAALAAGLVLCLAACGETNGDPVTVTLWHVYGGEVNSPMNALVEEFKDYFTRHGQVVYENPSPGNKAGGITTLEEKSLGCIHKGGHSPVMAVYDYAKQVEAKQGLVIMDTPGNDPSSVAAMVAGGAQIVVFSTGRGTPFSAPAPTLKISTNTPLAEKKSGWIDFNTGVIADGEKTIDEAAKDLLDLVIRVASGEQTKAEKHGFREISIFKDGVVL